MASGAKPLHQAPRRESLRGFKTGVCVIPQQEAGAKCSSEIYRCWAASQPSGQEDTTWDIATPTTPSPLLPPCQRWKALPQPLHKEKPTANSFTLSPRQEWWLRTKLFVPDVLLQLSIALLPALFNHLPSKAAFSQSQYLKQRTRLCYPRHAAWHSQGGIHPAWRQPQHAALKKRTLWDGWGTTTLHRDNIPPATRTWYLSTSYSLALFLCVHKILVLIHSPGVALQWGCFFQCLITRRGDHSVSCGCSALHSFLPKTWAILSYRSCWQGQQAGSEMKDFWVLPTAYSVLNQNRKYCIRLE